LRFVDWKQTIDGFDFDKKPAVNDDV